MLRDYEGAFIFRASLDEDALAAEMSRVEEQITAEGGEIKEWEKWGKRRLAYEIRGEHDGVYAFLAFKADPASIEKLVAAYRLRENILRNMNLVKDE